MLGAMIGDMTAFLKSEGSDDAIRKAISLGGDSDTIACITGGIAETFYGVPEEITAEGQKFLPAEFQLIAERFTAWCREI